MLNDCFKVLHSFQARTLVTPCPCLHVVEFVYLCELSSMPMLKHIIVPTCEPLYFIYSLGIFIYVSWVHYLFLCVNRKYLEEPCVWVESNTTTLSILSSHAEIGLGFLMIISFFSWDSQIYIYMYFNYCTYLFPFIVIYVFAYFWSLSNS